jgi:hypothetical protein
MPFFVFAHLRESADVSSWLSCAQNPITSLDNLGMYRIVNIDKQEK